MIATWQLGTTQSLGSIFVRGVGSIMDTWCLVNVFFVLCFALILTIKEKLTGFPIFAIQRLLSDHVLTCLQKPLIQVCFIFMLVHTFVFQIWLSQLISRIIFTCIRGCQSLSSRHLIVAPLLSPIWVQPYLKSSHYKFCITPTMTLDPSSKKACCLNSPFRSFWNLMDQHAVKVSLLFQPLPLRFYPCSARR